MQDDLADERFPNRVERFDVGEILLERSELLMQRLHGSISLAPRRKLATGYCRGRRQMSHPPSTASTAHPNSPSCPSAPTSPQTPTSECGSNELPSRFLFATSFMNVKQEEA